MAQDKDGLMTVEEFNLQVNKWASKIAMQSRQTLRTSTRGSGTLANSLMRFVDKRSTQEPAYKVKFSFDRYGVFRAYGAGRGYVVMNGQIMKGYRIRSIRDIQEKKWSPLASEYRKKGYSTREINSMKGFRIGDSVIHRSKLDWIDYHIEAGVETLADFCQEFYGDDAGRQILRDLDSMKIVKK